MCIAGRPAVLSRDVHTAGRRRCSDLTAAVWWISRVTGVANDGTTLLGCCVVHSLASVAGDAVLSKVTRFKIAWIGSVLCYHCGELIPRDSRLMHLKTSWLTHT